MKKILIIIILFGCSYSNLLAQLTLKCINGENKQLVGLVDVLDEKNNTVGLVKDGEVEVKLNISHKGLFVLGYDKEVYFLYGEPGQEYVFDCSDKSFSGGNQKINDFLHDWQNDFFKIPSNTLRGTLCCMASQNTKNKVETKVLLAPDFVPNLKVWQENQKKMFDKFKCQDKDFNRLMSNYIYTSYWDRLTQAAFLIRFQNQKVPENFLDEILKMEINQTGFTEKDYAEKWLGAYIKAMQEKGLIKPVIKNYVFKIASSLENPKLREFYVLNELKNRVKREDLVCFKDLFSSADSYMITPEEKDKFNELYNQAIAAIDKNKFDGVQTAELSFFTPEGEKVSLSDYAGKYVYIDCWATWCGPCKKETPHFLKLAEHMHGKNIVFLSLSSDRAGSEQQWKDYVKEHDLQKHCVAGWTGVGSFTPFHSQYQINSIPRFLLVAPDGKMIYNDCWRPSNALTIELLNSFLN